MVSALNKYAHNRAASFAASQLQPVAKALCDWSVNN